MESVERMWQTTAAAGGQAPQNTAPSAGCALTVLFSLHLVLLSNKRFLLPLLKLTIKKKNMKSVLCLSEDF